MAGSSSQSQSQSQSPQQTPFHQSPQQFNKSHRKATEVVQNLVSLIQKGPRTLVGTIADISFHASMGYVLCQAQSGVVQVYGVPTGSVIAGMRIFYRQMGGMSTNKQFVYDGPASALSSMGSQGSLILQSLPMGPVTSALASLSGVPSSTGLIGPTGYYWHCFFCVSALPLTPVTLFQMAQDGNTATFVALELLPSGLLQFRSQDGHGYITQQPIVPQTMHWVVIQPGLSGAEFVIDDLTAYQGLAAGSEPTFAGNGLTYTLSLLSNGNGTHMVPLGSWVSKVGYGLTNSTLLTTTFPEDDSELPLLNPGTLALFLCEDTPGTSTMINSAPGTPVGPMLLSSPATLIQAGPY